MSLDLILQAAALNRAARSARRQSPTDSPGVQSSQAPDLDGDDTTSTTDSSPASTPVPSTGQETTLGSSSVFDDDGDGALVPSRFAIPSADASNQQMVSRKRPRSVDMSSFTNEEANRYLLKGNNREMLMKFSKLSAAQQNITLYAAVLKQGEEIQQVAPPTLPFVIPEILGARIDKYTYIVLVDPSLALYTGDSSSGPVELILQLLGRFPGWGYTEAVSGDCVKSKAIRCKIQTRLTHIRSTLKHWISEYTTGESPRDIYTLCQKITSTYSKMAPKAKVSVEMAARFAFLRMEFVEQEKGRGGAGRLYWDKVDASLRKIREATGNDSIEVSHVFAEFLDNDKEEFGYGNCDGLTVKGIHGLYRHVDEFEATLGRSCS